VAGRAFDSAGAFRKLSLMLVGMAIRAVGEGEWLFEVAFAMAGGAVDLQVLSQQWVFRLGVVKTPVQRGRGDDLPSTCVVAGSTGLGKAAFVRIGMAIGTFAEREPLKTRLLIRARRVALLAFHLCMQAGERELGLGMVEFSGRIFPVRTVVALRAVVTQAAIVHVLVARRAG